MNLLFALILFFVVFDYLLETALDYLNKRAWSNEVPNSLTDIYPPEKFEKHKAYRLVNYNFGQINAIVSVLLMIAFLWLNGFAFIDSVAVSFTNHPIGRALIFFALIGILSSLVAIPFSWYNTFVIEAKFEFNKTTQLTFWMDILKGWLLMAFIGAPILAAIIWFYSIAGSSFWIFAWLLVAIFSIFMSMFYTTLILPLFNKQTPLPNGELRQAIEEMALKAGFKMDNVFVLDGSKRSTKANAFFSGLGPKKRIVLYDTLVNEYSTNEIVAVLAHEIGHYKLKHTLWGTLIGVVQTGVILFLFSLMVDSPQLSLALGSSEPLFHIGLLAFGIILTPLNLLLGLFGNWLSRQNEYAADKFAASYINSTHLISALKKLTASSLGNVTPHPVYVFFHYSHPSLLQRINAISKQLS